MGYQNSGILYLPQGLMYMGLILLF